MKRLIAVLAVFSFVAVSGCATAPQLAPAAETQLADGGPGAVGTNNGVRVVATVDEWRWNPPELDEFVTPILLRVENNSDHTVRIRLKDIRLVSSKGVRLAALPPYRVRGEAKRTVRSGVYAVDRFYVAPYLYPYYRRYPRAPFFFYHDSFYYYRTYYPLYRTYSIPLPTQDMLDRALPEGALEPGGTATGYVYFQRVDKDVAKRTNTLDLLFQVVDAESQENLGVASIRFDVIR